MKKHWRDVYKSDYLASWDLDKDVVLTISRCSNEFCKLSKGKEEKVIAYFEEKTFENGTEVKPMILNPTNCKLIQTKTNIHFFQEWKGLKVKISVQENKGGIGEKFGLRIVDVFSDNFDINMILSSQDATFCQDYGNKFRQVLTEAHKKIIREHIAKIQK